MWKGHHYSCNLHYFHKWKSWQVLSFCWTETNMNSSSQFIALGEWTNTWSYGLNPNPKPHTGRPMVNSNVVWFFILQRTVGSEYLKSRNQPVPGISRKNQNQRTNRFQGFKKKLETKKAVNSKYFKTLKELIVLSGYFLQVLWLLNFLLGWFRGWVPPKKKKIIFLFSSEGKGFKKWEPLAGYVPII